MRNGISPIIIDNTNLHAWEMKPYAVMVGKVSFWIFSYRHCVRKLKPLFFLSLWSSRPHPSRWFSQGGGKEVSFSCSRAAQWVPFADLLISPWVQFFNPPWSGFDSSSVLVVFLSEVLGGSAPCCRRWAARGIMGSCPMLVGWVCCAVLLPGDRGDKV